MSPMHPDYLIRDGSLEEIASVERTIPEFPRPKSADQLAARLGVPGALLKVACADGRPVAYKAGYPLPDGWFYSWTGAVQPAHRRRGLALALLQEQERLVREAGYAGIRVKSRNGFPSMLQLLIGQGYRIVDLEPVPSAADPKIHFAKPFPPSTP